MPGRRRTSRYVLLAVLAALLVLYFRTPAEVYEPYVEKAQNAVGGGSVLRPDPRPEEKEGSEAKPGSGTVDRPAPPPPAQQPTPKPAASTTSSASLASSTSQPPAVPTSSDSPPLPVLPPVDDEDVLPHEQGAGRVTVDVSATPVIHWLKTQEHFPVESTIQLPTGKASSFPKLQIAKNGPDKNRLAMIKAAAEFSWGGYKEKAWGHDELMPVTGNKHDVFNGWGATLVDSLDTLWVMGLKDSFDEAVQAVGEIDFTTSSRSDIPLFETTIRYLGGLVAAYDVSGRQSKYSILLEKAVELAEVLYSAFDTPNRMPQTYYRWKPTFSSQPHRAGNRVVLAELGSLSMEFTRLAQLTGEPKYYDAIARITDALQEWQNNTRVPGMWPTNMDASGCQKPAQIAHGSSNRYQQPLPNGEPGMMQAGAPVQAHRDSLDAQQEGQRELKEAIAQGKPGLGKIIGHGSPIEEGSLDDPTAKADILGPAAGPNKRQIGAGQELAPGKMNNASPRLRSSENICVPQGLASTSASGSETYTLGGESDSTYEYLPKQHVLLGGQVAAYEEMYLASAEVEVEKLLFRPMTPGNLDILISGELKVTLNHSTGEWIERLVPKQGHLTCFAGGMFALGGVLFDKPEHVDIGRKLTDGCIWAYNSTASGIMPEDFLVLPCETVNGTRLPGFEESGCEWNETRYWMELDPYQDTRTRVFEPVPRKTQAAIVEETATREVETTALPTQTVRLEHAPGDYAHVKKRQLEGAPVLDAAAPTTTPAAKAAGVPTAEGVQPLSSTDDGAAFGVATTMPTLTPSTTRRGVFTNAQPHPLYTPPAPLSHEEYVKQKIEDERLPPGMTRISSRKYILRPEAIESVFYLYRITGDPYYREAGWQMYTAIQQHTRAAFGHAAIDDVTKLAPEVLDSMESFWLAETLKYFYLLFDEESGAKGGWSLDDWVLNTEAHFFRRPK